MNGSIYFDFWPQSFACGEGNHIVDVDYEEVFDDDEEEDGDIEDEQIDEEK